MVNSSKWMVFDLEFYIKKYTYIFFFFQAEDGIRDHFVTGVQTCALPISLILILCIYLLKLLQFIALLFRSWFKAFIFLQDRHNKIINYYRFLPTVDMQPYMIAFLSIFSA